MASAGNRVLQKFKFRGDKKTYLDDVDEDEALIADPKTLSRTVSASAILHRTASRIAVTSTFPGEVRRASAPHTTTNPDSFGLQLVSSAEHPLADIIFVHGLGGSAYTTWSWERDPRNFWPAWLAKEEGLSSFRILTFGYNSKWQGQATNLNISDFAKDLLLQLLTWTDGQRIGAAKIIFVAHSMGGLVVKKAFLLGKQDDQFSDIVANVYGVIFLATPHRGAQHATTLNNILSSTPLGPPPKAYVNDLGLQSNALQEINEQFRHCCEGLSLVSFFETLKTSFRVTKAMIVEKESAVLGYPHELSSPLHADHHTICKFSDRTEQNYLKIRNILKLWSARLPKSDMVPAGITHDLPLTTLSSEIANLEHDGEIRSFLGIRDHSEDDFKAVRNRVMAGSYNWFVVLPEFESWRVSIRSGPSVFWLVGTPATGKSALTSVVVEYLTALSGSCQYHFFQHHQTKRTIAYSLRSIALQLAQTYPVFRHRLIAFQAETGFQFSAQNQSFNVIWERIFEGIVSKIDFGSPLYWIFDAVDESDSRNHFISCLTRFQSVTPIRIFVSSRPIKLPPGITSHGTPITHFSLRESHTVTDIENYIMSRIREILPDDEQVQQDLIDQLMAKAAGSFLWVRLALESLQDEWHIQEDIRRILSEMPSGMVPLYKRMLDAILSQSTRTRLLAEQILTWVSCSWRPLRVEELETALLPKFGSFTKFEDTVHQVCGHFVSIIDDQVDLIHATARQFLLEDHEDHPAFIHGGRAHEGIALACLDHLSHDKWRKIFQPYSGSSLELNGSARTNRLLLAEQGHPFLGYATCYWAYHLSRSPTGSKDIMSALRRFFNNYCLSWIEAVALSSNMRYLIRSAKYLRAYAKLKARRSISSETLSSLKHVDEEEPQWIQSWAQDLIRIVGKFGSSLVLAPSSIHRDIPPFCPRRSKIGQIYGEPRPGFLSVSGLSSDGWDDCLASVSVGDNVIASKVLATEAFFLTLVNSVGQIVIWYAETCQKARTLSVNGYILAWALNKRGTLLATSSFESHCIWELSSGKLLYSIPKFTEASTKFVIFQEEDVLVFGSDDCSVTTHDFTNRTQLSRRALVHPPDYQGCPEIMSVSPDLKKVGLAWRGKPPIIWDMDASQHLCIQRCRVRSSADSMVAPESLVWHPDGSSLLVLCQDTNLVDWHIYDERQVVHEHIRARQIVFSSDGNLLLSSNSSGTISVWSHPRLSLIYQLVCDNYYVRDIAFSPDGQRIYDTRGSNCYTWEPDALIRPEELDLEDHSSVGDHSLATTEPAISYFDTKQGPVTALASSKGDDYYCCGREDGSVIIHDITDGKRLRKVYSHAATRAVLLLAWSTSGRYIVSCDDSARVIAKRLEVKSSGQWGVFPVLDIRLGRSVSQFLFSPNEQLLLVSGSSVVHIYDLKKKEVVHQQTYPHHQNRSWVQHPNDESLLLSVSPEAVSFRSWIGLEEHKIVELHSTSESGGKSAMNDYIVWVDYLPQKNQVIYATLLDAETQTSVSCLSHNGLHLETFDLSSDHSPSDVARQCNKDLAKHVMRLIGTYEGKIVYLDHDYWLCSWDLEAGEKGVKRHFVLPKDWLNVNSLQIAMVNEYGTFLFPKYSQVAAVRNGILP